MGHSKFYLGIENYNVLIAMFNIISGDPNLLYLI